MPDKMPEEKVYYVYEFIFACQTDETTEWVMMRTRAIGGWNVEEIISQCRDNMLGFEVVASGEEQPVSGTIVRAVLRQVKPVGLADFLPRTVAINHLVTTGDIVIRNEDAISPIAPGTAAIPEDQDPADESKPSQ